MCCPRQNEHTDIKKVANNHVTDILQRCQKGQNFVLLLPLRHTYYFHAISQELLQIQRVNTPLELFLPTGMPSGGHKTKTKNQWGIFATKSNWSQSDPMPVKPPPRLQTSAELWTLSAAVRSDTWEESRALAPALPSSCRLSRRDVAVHQYDGLTDLYKQLKR